jgi:hypothetical protein
MRMQVRPSRRSLSAGITLLAAAFFTACAPSPRGAPEPDPGCPSGTAPSTPEELDTCLRGLSFDSTKHASDLQPLTVIDSGPSVGSLRCPGDASGKYNCRYGPMARIEPLRGAQRYSEEDLREGRIIARITVPAGETEKYPKYGLVPGEATYWWVKTDSNGTGGVSVFVTTGKAGKLQQVERPLKRERYGSGDRGYGGAESEEGQWRALARWIWTLEDEKATTKCGSGSCE